MMVNLLTGPENTLSVIRRYYIGIASVLLTAVLSLIKVNGSGFLTNLGVAPSCQKLSVPRSTMNHLFKNRRLI